MAKTRSLKTGDPSSENSDLGALVSAEHRDRVMSYIDKAKQLVEEFFVVERNLI